MSQEPSGFAEPADDRPSDGEWFPSGPPYAYPPPPVPPAPGSPYASRYSAPYPQPPGQDFAPPPFGPEPPPPPYGPLPGPRRRAWLPMLIAFGAALASVAAVALMAAPGARSAHDPFRTPEPGAYRLHPPASLEGLRGAPDSVGAGAGEAASDWAGRVYGDPVTNGFELYGYNGMPSGDPAQTLRTVLRIVAQDSKTSVFAQATAVNPGSHGGAMACGSTNDGYVQTVYCYWASETSQFSLFAYGRPDYTTPSELAALARRIRAEDEVPDAG